MRQVVAVLLLCLWLAPATLAGGPVVHAVSGAEAFGKGTLEGLSLDDLGLLRLGPAFDSVPLDAASAWAVVATEEATWIGTGNKAEVVRVGRDGKVDRFATGDGLMVTALAPLPGGGVAAAVFPGGRIVRIGSDGVAAPLAAIPVEHLWALEPDGRGGFVAASGGPGALWSIDGAGKFDRLVDVADDHARCLSRRGEGWLVGTAPKGKILSFEGGRLGVVRDLEPQEVVGILPMPDGGLIVAANADQAGGNAQAIANLLKQIVEPPETQPGQAAAPRASLQDGRLLWIEPGGGVLTPLWQGAQVAVLSLTADGRGAVAGTYPAGRLVRVEPGQPSSVLADLPEAEASVVLAGGALVATSNPAALHRRREPAEAGTFTAAPLDAGATARWGRATATGSGVASLSFRAGETAEPDDSWTPWAPVSGFDGTAGSVGATARFLQVRASLQGEGAELREITVVAEAPNRAPVVSGVALKKPGDGRATPDREVAWATADPDNDRVETAIHFRRDGAARWTEVVKSQILATNPWVWSTAGLPDGVYRVRVTARDLPDNPADRAREGFAISGPVRIDNTAPRIVSFSARVQGDRLVVQGEVEEQAGGRVIAVRLSIDGGPFSLLAAADGLYDTEREGFAASLPLPEPGEHDLVVQASDQDANLSASATTLTR